MRGFALLLAMAAATCAAQVRWLNSEILLEMDSGQEGATAAFEFVNEGRLPVRIAKIEPGCGCAVPTLEKNDYSVGEKGRIAVRFSTGDRRGVYRVPIRVDFEGGQSAGLELIAQIRELVKVFPLNVAWSPGESRAPRDIEFHWNLGEMVEIVDVRSTNPAITPAFVTGHDWNGALLRLTLANDVVTGVAVVIVSTVQGPDRRVRTYTLVARVL